MSSTAERTYPLKKPEGHVPPVPRWQLILGETISAVHVAYVGIQRHSVDDPAVEEAARRIADTISQQTASTNHVNGDSVTAPSASEVFEVIDGDDAKGSLIWVCYWTDEAAYRRGLERLSPSALHDGISADAKGKMGVWLETFTLPPARLETNYTGLDYLPGLAQLPGTTAEPHDITAYWGAARDRIPASAHDLFPGATTPPESAGDGRGVRLVGTNADNLVHIRSGQFWENCDEGEAEAYERHLEPTLEAGLRHLWKDRDQGAMGLRYLRNTTVEAAATSTYKRKETCVTGFFASLDKLEGWAKTHKSHLAIYNGALRHAKKFGGERRFRTWHEVCVLKQGEGRFEYVNCLGDTGVIRFVELSVAG